MFHKLFRALVDTRTVWSNSCKHSCCDKLAETWFLFQLSLYFCLDKCPDYLKEKLFFFKPQTCTHFLPLHSRHEAVGGHVLIEKHLKATRKFRDFKK